MECRFFIQFKICLHQSGAALCYTLSFNKSEIEIHHWTYQYLRKIENVQFNWESNHSVATLTRVVSLHQIPFICMEMFKYFCTGWTFNFFPPKFHTLKERTQKVLEWHKLYCLFLFSFSLNPRGMSSSPFFITSHSQLDMWHKNRKTEFTPKFWIVLPKKKEKKTITSILVSNQYLMQSLVDFK